MTEHTQDAENEAIDEKIHATELELNSLYGELKAKIGAIHDD